MLHELRIENLLLIERVELRFADGLNAITGETGAGKTVLARSLDLLMGGKARPQIVRPGAGEAYVEGGFALPEDLFAHAELAQAGGTDAGGGRGDRARAPDRGVRPDERVRTGTQRLGERPAGAGLATPRLLWPARAPEARALLGATRDPRRLRRGRAPGAPGPIPRGACGGRCALARARRGSGAR